MNTQKENIKKMLIRREQALFELKQKIEKEIEDINLQYQTIEQTQSEDEWFDYSYVLEDEPF